MAEPPPQLTLPSALADRSDDIVGTWAEPAEEGAEAKPPPEPAPPRRRRNTVGGGRARIRTPLPERRWRDVLSGYAEHLTDEELAIIRAQLEK